jgi:hypothetical protein
MKMRDVSLIVAGAAAAVALTLVVPLFINNANAQQSAAAAGTPGANPVIVTSAGYGGNGANSGIIVVNDPANRQITAVSYQFTWSNAVGGNTNTQLGLSAKQVFTY